MDVLEPLRPSDPRTIGGYRLLRRLGSGGMGQVYLGRTPGGRAVAVKLVKAEVAEEAEFRHRFRLEVEAARRVGGTWTAPVLAADTEAEVPWVATGYLAGLSLHSVVAEDFGALPEYSVRALGNGLAEALRAIHSVGIVHRDLKPSNVLVTVGGPRIIDFGIVRALEPLSGSGLRTMTGAVLGSPGFMSPEQVRGEPVTPASDVFCLGAVLAFAATARMPFGRTDSGAHAVMYRIAEGDPDLTGLPQGLLGLVRGCLAREARDRISLSAVLALTGAEDMGVGRGRPWLPGEVLTRLGRQSELLLDVEELPVSEVAPQYAATEVALPSQREPSTPPGGGPGTPPGAGQWTPPGAGQATPPGAGQWTPPGAGQGTPPGVFGPLYEPTTETPLPPPAPTPGLPPPAGGDSGRRGWWHRRALRAAAIAVPLLLLAGGGWLLLGSGDKADGGGDPWASATAPSPDPGERSDLPQSMTGAWEGVGEDADGRIRVELRSGQVGTGVGVAYNMSVENLCVRRLVLVKTGARLVLHHAETLRRIPTDSCVSRDDHVREIWLEGNVLHWKNGKGQVSDLHSASADPTPVPEAFIGEWEADRNFKGTKSKLHIVIEQGGFGEPVEQRTQEWDNVWCRWNGFLISVQQSGRRLAFTPYELDPQATSSATCDPSRWHELEIVDADTMRSTVPGSGEPPIVYTRVKTTT
ncbi:serine/threonine-protein kinase [Streptomyces sp. NPDC051940]|uniref:serine/threonine protein kinase n=1 Tax=Streptomyces sp. NPDC051940 TaxID=3155675 RepID=UPI0034329E34